jgi:hypothetical protein
MLLQMYLLQIDFVSNRSSLITDGFWGGGCSEAEDYNHCVFCCPRTSPVAKHFAFCILRSQLVRTDALICESEEHYSEFVCFLVLVGTIECSVSKESYISHTYVEKCSKFTKALFGSKNTHKNFA